MSNPVPPEYSQFYEVVHARECAIFDHLDQVVAQIPETCGPNLKNYTVSRHIQKKTAGHIYTHVCDI